MDDNLRYPIRPRDNIAHRLIYHPNSTQVVFRHGHIAITNYNLGDNWEFEKWISKWDNWKYHRIAGYYYDEIKELRIPRGYSLDTIKSFFPQQKYQYVVDNQSNPSKDATITLHTPPRTDIQKLVLAHVLGLSPYESKKKYTQHAIDLGCGDGKTYTAIAVIAALCKRGIIFVPTKVIADQWIASILEFTSIKKNELCFINSGEKAYEVAKGKHKKCLVYVVMQGSFDSFVKTHGAYMGERMVYETMAHVKVIDEIHMNIKKVMAIEALSNCRLNLYLSATFDRADRIEKAIFKKCFADVPRIGISLKQKTEAHVNMAIGEYEWVPSGRAIGGFTTPKGVSPTAYEKELLREGYPYIRRAVEKMFKFYDKISKPDSKALIMTASIEGIEYFASVMKQAYPDKSVGMYHSKLSKQERIDALKCDIIIATTKGLGTGTDIKNLQFTHNIATYSNQKDSGQSSGRGRKMDDREIWYTEYVNMGFHKSLRQFNDRKPALIKKAVGNKLHHVNLR